MSGGTSPLNGEYDAASGESTMRLTVRKDLFPEVRLPKIAPVVSGDTDLDFEDDVSCVKLETDFEKSIDEIATQKQQIANGTLPSVTQPRHRKHKQRSRRDSERRKANGCLPPETKRRKRSPNDSQHKKSSLNISVPIQVKGGKNLNLVSSSECQEDESEDVKEESESSDDEVLKYSVKLPLRNMPRQSGKPYSHSLSQLSSKKSKNSSKERRTRAVIPCSGKPRSMLEISRSKSKKKSKKSEYKLEQRKVAALPPVPAAPTYQSQIVDTNTIKIKIKRTDVITKFQAPPALSPAISIADIGQRKSKKKRAASPVASESSGEEYDPSKGDTAAAMSVAAPKPRNQPKNPPQKSRKSTSKSSSTRSKSKSDKREKTDRSKHNSTAVKDTGPQSPWGTMPEEVLFQIFEYAVASQGTLPAVVRLGKVCKLWNTVSCRAELWRNVDLAHYTTDKCKTDYKLVWLLENRLSQCQVLNLAQWKVCNVSWVLACVADYCPSLQELSVAGWSRLTPEQLFELMQGLPNLQRIDLSSTSETGGSSTCLSAASMARVTESFGARLTHLTLANNVFTALPQILSSIAAHCPSLEVLDISAARATSHPAAVPLEALQRGCPRVRVFRAANSQLVLCAAQQTDSEGWTQLEELSIAGDAASERVAVGEYRLGDEALSRLVRGATRLRLLDLRGLQRLSDSGLVRVPAWDLHHLFLGGCNILRQSNACLELICEKWSHSLVELDLSWASAAKVLDAAVTAVADSSDTKLRILNLCGSSVSVEPVKRILRKCRYLESINLSSCRALPRGIKRLYTGKEIQDLKDSLDPEKVKAKEAEEKPSKKKKTKKPESETETETVPEETPKCDVSNSSVTETDVKSDKSEIKSPASQQSQSCDKTPQSASEEKSQSETTTNIPSKDLDSTNSTSDKASNNTTPQLAPSPAVPKPDSSSTPRSDTSKADLGSPYFSPLPKPDSQVQNSPELSESVRSNNSWSLGQFKTTPTHKSEASPLNRMESQNKLKHGKNIEQCSPTTSLENKPSPETLNTKQDIKNPNWNYGNYSPMPRQDSQFSQRSPYSAQPSPAQPSPYSTQPSPYSTQPSPYSSQPSPYSAQPSPDTSQMVKPDIQKPAWNSGNYSPMPKHPFPSPHPSTHTSPDPGLNVAKPDRSNPNKTPGQYSPMSRQDRIHQSPYSPRPSADNVIYSNKKSPGVGGYSPMMRPQEHLLPSPEAARQGMYRQHKTPEQQATAQAAADLNTWFNQLSSAASASIESLVWGSGFGDLGGNREESIPPVSPAAPAWAPLPPFESHRRAAWPAAPRTEPPLSFPDPSFERHFLDDYAESSRVD